MPLPAISNAVPWSGLVRGKRQPERYVHAAVECVQLQRDQSLIVVHAKHRVEFAFNRAVENGVGRNRTDENDVTSDR